MSNQKPVKEADKPTKEIVENLLRMEGEVRGMSLKDDEAYVKAKEGEGGLRKVEEVLEKLGCPIKYDAIKTLGFYPIGWRAISLLAIRETFGWGDEEFRTLGSLAPGNSLIVRIYTKFFHSIELVVSKAPQMWGEYFTRGKFTVPDYSEEKKYAITEIRDLDLHPIFCRLLEGYLTTIIKMVVKPKEIECRETTCTFKGQDRHRFEFRWK